MFFFFIAMPVYSKTELKDADREEQKKKLEDKTKEEWSDLFKIYGRGAQKKSERKTQLVLNRNN